MKRYLIITLLSAFISTSLLGQNIVNKQFALLNYHLDLTKEFRKDLEDFKSFFNSVDVHNKEAKDRLKAIMIHDVYYHLSERLEDEFEIDIMPINTFMQKIKYTDFGYPKTNINKALRVGDAHFYFKLRVIFDSMTEERKKNDPKLEGDIFFPTITINITVYNDEGVIPVEKWHGEKITYQPYELNKRLFRKFVEPSELPPPPKLEENEKEQQSLFELYDSALTELINNFLED